MKYIIILVLGVNLFLGCGKKPGETETQTNVNKQEVKSTGETNKNSVSDSLKYETKNFKKTYKDCKEENEKCSYLKISYIVFDEGSAQKEINKTLDAYIIDSIFSIEGKGSNKSIDGLATAFFSDYETVKKESPDFEPTYALDINSSVEFNKSKVLSVNTGYYIFTGGAHPNTFMRYFVFNPQTGKQLKLRDVLVNGFEDKLNKLIDKKYRSNNKLKDNERLDSEKGMLFENFIKFNDNFIFTKDGVEFLYNRYEIAAYVYGEIEVKFTYKELEEILKPEYKF